MDSQNQSQKTALFFILFVLLFSGNFQQEVLGMRPLEGDQWLLKKELQLLESSLQRGKVPPTSGSGCTHIPGGTGRCTMEINDFQQLESSLQRGTVPPSSGSGCTHIPGGTGRCTMEINNFQLLESSLQRGTVPPSSGSGCTHIPGGTGRCTMEINNFAATSAAPHLPAFPDHLAVEFAAAASSISN